jgi:hypothetical protein
MKINELLQDFTIYTTNEETALLSKISATPHPVTAYSEREQVILDNLVKKSLVSKIHNEGLFLVMRNDWTLYIKTTRRNS